MMPPDILDALGLDLQVIRNRSSFFASYAQFPPEIYDVNGLIDAARESRIDAGVGDPIVNLIRTAADIETLSVRRESWVGIAESADAWRQAAISQLLVETAAGRTMLLYSARDYQRIGFPFGLFLSVIATGSRRDTLEALDKLERLLSSQSLTDINHELQDNIAEAPAQQLALLLAGMSDPRLIASPESLSALLADNRWTESSAVVGPTLQPFSVWWQAGRQLLDMKSAPRQARAAVAAIVNRVALAHGEQLRFARADTYHWMHGKSSFDIVDLMVAGLVAISARILRRLGLPEWRIAEDFGSLPPLARLSIVIGLQLADDGRSSASDLYGPRPPSGPSPSSLSQPRSEEEGGL